MTALDKELDTFRAQGVWNEDGVRESRSVQGQSSKNGKYDLVIRLFVIRNENLSNPKT